MRERWMKASLLAAALLCALLPLIACSTDSPTEPEPPPTPPVVPPPGDDGVGEMEIFAVTPNTGPNEGGTRVRITGANFLSPLQVLFGGVEAVVESITSSELVVLTPAATGFGSGNANTSVTLTVRNLDSGAEAQLAGAFTYGIQMRIFAVSPLQVDARSGGLVTIFGEGFDAPLQVLVAGVEQTVLSVTGTEIVFRSPVLALCADFSGTVTVILLETGFRDTSTDPVTFLASPPVISSISPNSGPQAGNTLVTLTGFNFFPPLTVTFAGILATVQSVSAENDEVRVRTPALPNSALNTQSCTFTDPDTMEEVEGEQFLPTQVTVELITLEANCSATTTFTYIPTDGSCRGPGDVSGAP